MDEESHPVDLLHLSPYESEHPSSAVAPLIAAASKIEPSFLLTMGPPLPPNSHHRADFCSVKSSEEHPEVPVVLRSVNDQSQAKKQPLRVANQDHLGPKKPWEDVLKETLPVQTLPSIGMLETQWVSYPIALLMKNREPKLTV